MIGQAGLTLQPYKNTEVLEIRYLFKKSFGIMAMQLRLLRAVRNMLLIDIR